MREERVREREKEEAGDGYSAGQCSIVICHREIVSCRVVLYCTGIAVRCIVSYPILSYHI